MVIFANKMSKQMQNKKSPSDLEILLSYDRARTVLPYKTVT